MPMILLDRETRTLTGFAIQGKDDVGSYTINISLMLLNQLDTSELRPLAKLRKNRAVLREAAQRVVDRGKINNDGVVNLVWDDLFDTAELNV